MPAAIESVEPPIVVRDLHDDERLVVEEFDRHVKHCKPCNLALELKQDTLCERGHLLARDVQKYLYSVDGKTFSTVDRENGKTMRVKQLHANPYARRLLDNIANGRRLSSPRRGRATHVKPPVTPPSPSPRRSTSIRESYDATYQVPPRRTDLVIEHRQPRSREQAESPRPSSSTRIIERSPFHNKPRVVVYPSPHTSPNRSSHSRGSLYEADHQDRVERHYEGKHVRRRSDYYR
ncbi:hypothetical protein N7539_001073 [Penicillium diatomitis]|uniref:Uncharacterized protein n=1 Tax=Penicillium diatomitis TaxID=2819901 RepID=A0A9W9XN03_9EURO|nr:uncharacterized protein N7539_001073 [Penicillium diatomitis]KAJ5495957.1 hypothetical protein N7539_001073 [Penicillium diatomitis]